MHQESVVPDGYDLSGIAFTSYNGGFIKYYTFVSDINKGVGRTEIDSDVPEQAAEKAHVINGSKCGIIVAWKGGCSGYGFQVFI